MNNKAMLFLWAATLASCSDTTPISPLSFTQSAYATEQNKVLGFEAEKCWFHIPVDREMICGTATVLEDRSNLTGKKICIPVVQLLPDKERHEPVVFLSGGPGQTSEIDTDENITEWWRFSDEQVWLRGRRLILFDQRGIGRSIPNLNCSTDFNPKIWSKRLDHPSKVVDFDAEKLKEIIACRKRIIAGGSDLSKYNTKNIAADVDDIQRYLGIDRWAIYGVSYGTELGFAIMKDYANSISAAILDSVLPLGVNYVSMDEMNLNRSIDRLDRSCDADKRCRHDGPKIKDMIELIIEQLDASPVMIRISGEDGEKDGYSSISGSEFLDILFDMFYDRDMIGQIPRVVRRAYQQDYSYLADAIRISDEKDQELHFSDGMGYSVVCSENDVSIPIVAANSKFRKWASGGEYQIVCPQWFVSKPKIRSGENQIKKPINVPTLMLSGEFDPVTPAIWAKGQTKMISHAKTYVFKGVGHDVLDSAPCSSSIIAQFLQGKKFIDDTECTDELAEPEFDDVKDYE